MRIRKVERSEVGQKRLALAGGNLSLVIGSITVGLIVLIAAFFSQGNGSLPANPNDHSSSLSSSVFSSSSSTVQPAAQAAAIPYPLVWGPNPVRPCSGWPFCIIATLGFADNATLTTITSITTIIQGNATTYETNPITSYHVEIYALVQDAVTGQNATGLNGPVVGSGCYIHPTGFSQCIVGAPYTPGAPNAPHYKVTLFVTSGGLPCTIRIADLICSSSSQLLAPPIPPVTGDF